MHASQDYNCTIPPLRLEYQGLVRYSGEVHCGSLILKNDAHFAPRVSYPQADPHKLFTFIMLDPDAGFGFWPDNSTFGDITPIRHYVVGNIRGSDLHDMEHLSESGVELWPYQAPRVQGPYGSHRYGFFLYEQPTTSPIPFEKINSAPILWDYAAWLEQYNFSSTHKLASNYMIVVYDGSPDNFTKMTVASMHDMHDMHL